MCVNTTPYTVHWFTWSCETAESGVVSQPVVSLLSVCNRCGGVEMVAQDGKIKLDNTLDSRLALISQQVSK